MYHSLGGQLKNNGKCDLYNVRNTCVGMLRLDITPCSCHHAMGLQGKYAKAPICIPCETRIALPVFAWVPYQDQEL